MKKEIENIYFINRYLLNNKNDNRKKKLVRGYLTSKVNSILSSKLEAKNSDIVSNIFKMPLSMLSL